ncbi:MAG: hypothetical protein R3B84_02015 [Zavarzinella sp.]
MHHRNPLSVRPEWFFQVLSVWRLVVAALITGFVTKAPRIGFDGYTRASLQALEPHSADGIRISLCGLGMLLIGAGISQRPTWFGGWVFAAFGSLLCYGYGQGDGNSGYWFAAIPNSWDSMQTVSLMVMVISLLAIIACFIPRKISFVLISVFVFYHFMGIYSAITAVPPAPWLSTNYWARVARPYLHFVYLNNAYQFYSPDPGPSSLCWFCITYEEIQPENSNVIEDASKPPPKQVKKWVKLPSRETDNPDPFSLIYFRYLATIENAAHTGAQQLSIAPIENQEMVSRRNAVINEFPKHPDIPDISEYRHPPEHIPHLVVPSFTKHIARSPRYQLPGMKIVSMKVYRVEHSIPDVHEFRGRKVEPEGTIIQPHPYYPGSFLPFYLGEYSADGRLINPEDPMLYWLVPIFPRPDRVFEAQKRDITDDEYSDYYIDVVTIHAGADHRKELLK